MRRWSRYLVGAAAVAGLLVLAAPAGAETGTLEIKKLGTPAGSNRSDIPVDYLFRATYPQTLYQQIGGPPGAIVRSGDKKKPDFSEVIKKEPAEYATDTPFRGVVSLGSGHYGFVLDIAPPKKEDNEKAEGKGETKDVEDKKDKSDNEGGILSILGKAFANPLVPKSPERAKVPHYTRLHFDLNHNGDLTDDEVIEAGTGQIHSSAMTNYASFPTVELQIEVDGKKVDYAFTLSVYTHGANEYSFVNLSVNAAAYRDGTIVLDGKKRRIVLIDFNSNGRFDDVGGVNDEIELSDGTVYPKMGDRLYIDPQMQSGYSNPYDPTSSKDQFQVGKLIRFGDRLYDLKIDPSGETLSLEPSSASLGYITNPNKGFRAMIYGDQGVLEIDDNGSGRASVPEGRWKLMSYTIEKPEEAKPEEAKPEAGEKKKEESILDVLSSVLSLSGGRQAARRSSMVSARAKREFEAVTVVGGKDVEMRFGPPYIAAVAGANLHKGMTTSLEMSLVGIGGEVCTSLIVNGSRPSAPEFTISTKDGEEVAAGKFQYG